MPTRDTLHRLIDEPPESELTTAERFLNYLRATADPVLKALLDAPIDGEPETEEERRAVQAADAGGGAAGAGRVSWTVVLTASAQQAATPALHLWSHHSPGGTVILAIAMGSHIAPSS
jgi:hypothetical protein